MTTIHLDRDQYLELEKIGLGALAPVIGFMTETELHSVVDHMRLPGGAVFPLPVILPVQSAQAQGLECGSQVDLYFHGTQVGVMQIKSIFEFDKKIAAQKVFGTTDPAHPGVSQFLRAPSITIGGPVKLLTRVPLEFDAHELTPEETKRTFNERGWQTVAGFQTRNVPHRAHEYLQRIALEHVDGLFIQPLVGRKKKGDYTPIAVITGYKALISEFFPPDKVAFGVLSTAMRYAGPREAVFHAIVRRNYGCTHFIVGRDHAGVRDYYGKYQAQQLTRQFEGELGIEIMRLHGPYHCSKCDGIVTEQTCPHEMTDPSSVTHISGTDMRAMLIGGRTPAPHLMRDEVISSLRDVPLFITDENLDDQ